MPNLPLASRLQPGVMTGAEPARRDRNASVDEGFGALFSRTREQQEDRAARPAERPGTSGGTPAGSEQGRQPMERQLLERSQARRHEHARQAETRSRSNEHAATTPPEGQREAPVDTDLRETDAALAEARDAGATAQTDASAQTAAHSATPGTDATSAPTALPAGSEAVLLATAMARQDAATLAAQADEHRPVADAAGDLAAAPDGMGLAASTRLTGPGPLAAPGSAAGGALPGLTRPSVMTDDAGDGRMNMGSAGTSVTDLAARTASSRIAQTLASSTIAEPMVSRPGSIEPQGGSAAAASGVSGAGTTPQSLAGAWGLNTGMAAAAPASGGQVSTPVGHPGFAQAFAQQASEQVRWLHAQGRQEARIDLNPIELGPVTVQVQMLDGQATVVLAAQQAETRAALEASLPRLRELLENAGLGVGQASVGDFSQMSRQSTDSGASGDSRSAARTDLGSGSGSAAPASSGRTIARSDAGLVDTFA